MMQLLSVALLLVGLAQGADKTTAKSGKSCKALALSGGGAKGAYEAGALWGLVMGESDTSKFAYDVVTGVSAGAINTGAISVFKPGDEKNLVQFLSDTWAGINDGNVFQNWSPLGIVTGVFSKSGVLDNKPLMDFLASIFKQFDYKFQRKIAVSCVDVVTGDYIVFNETTSDIVKAITSSASIPFVFPNQQWPNGVVCMDGGTVWNTNLASAIRRCREQVDSDDQITLDVIICDDYQFSTWSDQNNAYNNFLRFKEIKESYQDMSDVFDLMEAQPDINYRYYLQPSEPLPGGVAIINFDNTTSTWPMQMIGRLDGENALKDGEGFMFNKMKEWRDSQDLQLKYPKVNDYVTSTVKQRARLHQQERRQESSEEPQDLSEAEQAYENFMQK